MIYGRGRVTSGPGCDEETRRLLYQAAAATAAPAVSTRARGSGSMRCWGSHVGAPPPFRVAAGCRPVQPPVLLRSATAVTPPPGRGALGARGGRRGGRGGRGSAAPAWCFPCRPGRRRRPARGRRNRALRGTCRSSDRSCGFLREDDHMIDVREPPTRRGSRQGPTQRTEQRRAQKGCAGTGAANAQQLTPTRSPRHDSGRVTSTAFASMVVGVSICSRRPARITPTRSAMANACS